MSSQASAPLGQFRLANIPLSLAIFFGMWACYESGYTPYEQLPFAVLMSPIKSLGLFLFRREWVLQYVFWAGVLAHFFEAYLGYRICAKLKLDAKLTLLWFIQTAAVGYPSLQFLLRDQRKFLKANKQ